MVIKLATPEIGDEEVEAVEEVLRSGWLAHGPKNHEFEEMFRTLVGVKHAITCNSCTSALFLAIKALGITGEVIIPSFSFVATANAVVTAGATPIFADIDSDTCNVSPEAVEAAISTRTEAIMPVHFGGQTADMEALGKIALEHGLHIIEDSAETIGGTFRGAQAGSFGIGCFSFFPTKNMTTGEGGMVTTNDDGIARKIRAMIGHGIDSTTYQREKKEMPWFRSAVMPGFNFRMSNVLAAIGVEQMKRLESMNERRRTCAALLMDGLSDLDGLTLPTGRVGNKHVYQMFTVQLAQRYNRDRFVHALNAAGVGASVHFFPPIHEQECYRDRAEYRRGALDVTEDVARRIVTLPMSSNLTSEECHKIVDVVREALPQARD